MKGLPVFVIGGLAVVMALLLTYGGTSLVRVWQMKREVEALERELGQLRADTERLTHAVDRLRDDPAEIEKIAREELGYVKKGEKVLKFPPTSTREATR
jgi:cell division protein FtsB